ncbi:CLUMA_CG013832, isoform A [Clunio marinus]|uniref:CLUMA_CG013832, isoform A n=1 Tax=Clunio marinus TaxID=568069 RepID=A0A1J1ILY1_9DIPT|nr:CLUMA_CG013832, isoform A [Clunio marinus]
MIFPKANGEFYRLPAQCYTLYGFIKIKPIFIVFKLSRDGHFRKITLNDVVKPKHANAKDRNAKSSDKVIINDPKIISQSNHMLVLKKV